MGDDYDMHECTEPRIAPCTCKQRFKNVFSNEGGKIILGINFDTITQRFCSILVWSCTCDMNCECLHFVAEHMGI